MNFFRLFERKKMSCPVATPAKGKATAKGGAPKAPEPRSKEPAKETALSLPTPPPPPPRRLSEDERRIVIESWRALQDDITRVGVILFVRLFETHPECKDSFFQFRDIEDVQRLRLSKQLRSHGLRVMSLIEKTVARLDQDAVLEQLIFELGRKHYKYNAPPKYYEFVGAEFISAVKPVLGDRWTQDVDDAWQALFKYITTNMERGFREEESGFVLGTVAGGDSIGDKNASAVDEAALAAAKINADAATQDPAN
ncbi:neuroglobin-like [Lampetra fluviatilis]